MGNDRVARFLIESNLLKHENQVRSFLALLGGDTDKNLTIATVVTLLGVSRIDAPVLTKVTMDLSTLRDEDFESDDPPAIAIMNGGYILLPVRDPDLRVRFLDIQTLRQCDGEPISFVTTIYGVGSVWKRVRQTT